MSVLFDLIEIFLSETFQCQFQQMLRLHIYIIRFNKIHMTFCQLYCHKVNNFSLNVTQFADKTIVNVVTQTDYAYSLVSKTPHKSTNPISHYLAAFFLCFEKLHM